MLPLRVTHPLLPYTPAPAYADFGGCQRGGGSVLTTTRRERFMPRRIRIIIRTAGWVTAGDIGIITVDVTTAGKNWSNRRETQAAELSAASFFGSFGRLGGVYLGFDA